MTPDRSARLYLDLLGKSLIGELYLENEMRLHYLRTCLDGQDKYDEMVSLRIESARPDLWRRFRQLVAEGRMLDDKIENLGFPHTMIGRARLRHLEWCLEQIIRDGVPGDLMECGVWRGGATVFMRGFLAAHDIRDRVVWAADSFAGPPSPSLPQDLEDDLSAARYPALAIPLETVQDLFARYSLLDQQVLFLPGWFKNTLPAAPVNELALLRVDADLYESTWDVLAALYEKVSSGGFVIVDDYNCISACRQAVDRFRDDRCVQAPLVGIDWTGVFWRKP